MGCLHLNSAEVKPPRHSQSVYREDCTQCFDSVDDPTGLNVCLTCFNGGCTGTRNHAALHHSQSGHPLALNIKRRRKFIKRDEPPAKMSKLAIAPVTEEDRYDTLTKVICYECHDDDVDFTSTKLVEAVGGVMNALTFARMEEVKAWELELTPCEHTLCLLQTERGSREAEGLSQCSQCEMRENLWLCLQCGNVGCGRSQFGGIGGNSHALSHAQDSTHHVSVKLNSITPEGSADIFCYACNEERLDPDLPTHLAHWGILLTDQTKTEKSLTEMQIEQNLNWDFTMTTNDGNDLKPVFGPGLTGLKNLGNSCYLASALQCLFSLPDFRSRYFQPQEPPPETSHPGEDFETQLRKMADGLISGRYSIPNSHVAATTNSQDISHQLGLSPAMLKHLLGRGHEEFSTMRQQDAFELIQHLFKLINLNNTPAIPNPVDSFRFALEQRLQCLACGGVRYKVDIQDNISVPVPARRVLGKGDTNSQGNHASSAQFERISLKECLDLFTTEEIVELTCTGCGSNNGFRKQSLFKSFPKNLLVNARRFELVNWVPTKLDVPLEVGEEPLDLSPYLSRRPDEGELLLKDVPCSEETEFHPNSEAIGTLVGMGFPENRIKKALKSTGNSDVDAALNWLLEHMDDTDIDDSGFGQPPNDSDAYLAEVDTMVDMGIDRPKAQKALLETAGDINRALDWVLNHPDDPGFGPDELSSHETEFPGSSNTPAHFHLQSIICHKGASVHTGHYVAFVRKRLHEDKEPDWVLFNDEKVVLGGNIEEMKQFAYIYFFTRIQ